MDGISLSWTLRIQELEVTETAGRYVGPVNRNIWMQIVHRYRQEELQVQGERLSEADALLGQAADQQVTPVTDSGMRAARDKCLMAAEKVGTAST